MSLVLNIVTDYVSGYYITNTPYKVSIIPKLSRPKLFPQIGIFLECFSRRYTLHYLHYICRRVFRRCFGEYVHMIFHHLHCVYMKTIFFCNALKHILQIFRYLSAKYLFTVLWYPYQMVFKIIDSVFGSSYSHAVFYISYYFVYQDSSRLAASRFHPASKLAGIQRKFL